MDWNDQLDNNEFPEYILYMTCHVINIEIIALSFIIYILWQTQKPLGTK